MLQGISSASTWTNFWACSINPSSLQSIVIVFHMSINILMLETVSEGVVIAHIPAATHISFIRRPSSKMLLLKNPFFLLSITGLVGASQCEYIVRCLSLDKVGTFCLETFDAIGTK